MTIKLLNSEWEPRKEMTYWVLERADGRCVRVTKDGIWECSRDGKGSPLALIGTGIELFDRVERLVARNGSA